MYDKGKIVTGLVVFFVILAFPFWYNMGAKSPAPELELTDKAKEAEECVEDTAFMTQEHMQLLDEWRDSVARDGNRIYVSEDGTEHVVSLSDTCMDCHSNKADFCDRCHDYVSADPYCWDCHTFPEENN